MITRTRALCLIAGAVLLPSCGAEAPDVVQIGSTSSSENTTVAEIYAAALEREHVTVHRHMNLGDRENAMAAIERGDIDLFPDYVQTGAKYLRDTSRYGITWLTPSPMNESLCLATSQYVAEEYSLLTLTKCAELARELRLAATPDFLKPNGPLQRLKNYYDGFQFKKVVICDPGTQYYLLNRGEAEVANAFTTDMNIAEDELVVLADDKRFWPAYNLAPVVRVAMLHAHPRARLILNRVSRRLTTYALQEINMHRDLLHMDARDVAEEFVRARK